MRSISLALVASLGLVATVLGSPIAEGGMETEIALPIVKRAGEAVHLGACVDGPNPARTFIVFCPDDDNCNHPPSSNNVVFQPGIQTLEGTHQVTFNSGVTFSWTFDRNAFNFPFKQRAGGASNGFHSFNCFRDDNHDMFIEPTGGFCKTFYFCI